MAISSTFIEQDAYDAIVEQMPIPCVDVIFIHEGKFLLSYRTNDPGKDSWFPVGGRVYKGERLIETAVRKAKEETGLSIELSDLSAPIALESIFTGEGVDQNRHSVNVVYGATLTGAAPSFNLDSKQLEEVAWFSEIDPTWHPYVQEALRALGFS